MRERRARWARLESLLDAAERLPDREIGTSAPAASWCGSTARPAPTSTRRARTPRTPSCSARLNDLAGRGYRFVYRRAHGRRMAREAAPLLRRARCPRAFRARARATCSRPRRPSCSGRSLGLGAVVADRGNAERLIPPEFFTESPKERVERIEASEERIGSLEDAAAVRRPRSTRTTSRSRSWPSAWARSRSWAEPCSSSTTACSSARWPRSTCSTASRSSSWPGSGRTAPWSCRRSCSAAPPGCGSGGRCCCRASSRPATALRRALPSVWRMLAGTAIVLVVAGRVEGSFSQFTARTIPYPAQDRRRGAAVRRARGLPVPRRAAGATRLERRALASGPDAGARRRSGSSRPASAAASWRSWWTSRSSRARPRS